MKLTQRFDAALGIAAELHREDTRKGTDLPYLSHPLSVCALVMEHGGSEDDAIAALLHDAIEDHPDEGRTATLIKEVFGPRVLEQVLAVSDSTELPKKPWRDRKEGYVARLAVATPEVARLVAADKVHNCRCIVGDLEGHGSSIWGRFSAPPEQIAWYYRACLESIRDRAPQGLVRELIGLVGRVEIAVAAG